MGSSNKYLPCSRRQADCVVRLGQPLVRGAGSSRRKRLRTEANNNGNLKVLFCILVLLHCSIESGHCIISSSDDFAPVRITIQPNDLIAIEGESAELNCDAEGEPEPIIEWYHNGQLIKSSSHTRTTMGGSIQFLDIRPISSTTDSSRHSDAGVYHCLARNSLGQARSRNATLQVAYIKEDFRLAPKDKLATIGETVTFECLPQAWPEPRILWRHNGRLIGQSSEGRPLEDGSAKHTVQRIARADQPNSRQPANKDQPLVDLVGSQLVIKRVDKSDEGRYSCLVETKGSHRLIERESPQAQLSAMVKPYFVEAPQSKSVAVGAQVRLKCRMGGDPEPVISWRKQNGQPLSEKTMIDPIDKTLIMDQLTIADQGTYICEGENPIGSVKSVATVSVHFRPKFNVQPTDQEVDLGSRVRLNCAGDASPPPMLFWYKEGHRQLMFAPDTSSNKAGPPQVAALDLSEHRYGSIPSSDTSPAINKLFTMPLNGDTIYNNNYFGNRIYVDNQGALNIINVTSSDSGYYACALISSVGAALSKAKITIKQKPKNPSSASDYYNSPDPSQSRNYGGSTSGKYDLLPAPVIKLGAENQTLPTNTSAILVCEVVSQVAYKVQWFFESQPLQEEQPRLVVLDSGALSINNLKPSDSGTYTCVVTAANDQQMHIASSSEPLDASMLTFAPPIPQSTTHSTMLKVASPMNPNIQFYRMDTFANPSSPGAAYMVKTNGEDAITIAWAAPADSGKLPIKEYIVEHYDTSQEYLGWREIHRLKGKESLLIDGLSPDGSHFFVIRAANGHGVGPSSAIAGPMRTVAGESKYQQEIQRRRNPLDTGHSNFDISELRPETNIARERLMTIGTTLVSLTPVSSSSMRLKWVVGNSSSSSYPSIDQSSYPLFASSIDDFLEGYSIRFRPYRIGESTPTSDIFSGGFWNMPAPLPLVTSFVEDEEQVPIRTRRDVAGNSYFDHLQEFSEVKVVDRNTDQYTISGLKPFTLYQFFVVPYYKEIDGVPSNIVTAQTNEDRPSVAPPNLTIRPNNSTSIRLLWLHIPPTLSNGVLRGYTIRINHTDTLEGQALSDHISGQTSLQPQFGTSQILNLPLAKLNIAPLTNFNPESRASPNANGVQHYVVMYDLTNLIFKSFYSIQVAGATGVGLGPWSEPQNFIMEPKSLSQMRVSGNDFDDVMSKSMISAIPHSYGDSISSQSTRFYYVISAVIIIASVLIVVGFILYRRNNQKVITWKKTISEHFTNKFYMPSSVDPRGPNSIHQQNIYDHQQHLIYSDSAHMAPQPVMHAQTMWSNNNCLNSSGTGSLTSHGGLLPINNDPNTVRKAINNEQILLINNKDTAQRFVRNNGINQPLINQTSVDSSRSIGNATSQPQIIHHGGDYYSIITNPGEYEELDQQQTGNIQLNSNPDRHQTGSSNSDTSCPSSVTRLLPNQNYNRDLLSKGLLDNQRHEMILQQQIGCNPIDNKQPFVTMINGDHANKMQSITPLSPYATTNLMNQQQNMINQPMSMMDHIRQQNMMHHNGGSTMDNSSRMIMAHQMSGPQNTAISSFRTLQRTPVNIQTRGNHFQPQQMCIQSNNGQFQSNQQKYAQEPYQTKSVVTNITSNPLIDPRSNLYEPIDSGYSGGTFIQDPSMQAQKYPQQMNLNDPLSSSTSSGSLKSSPPQNQTEHASTSKFRRGSATNGNLGNEAHDLRVFSSAHASKPSDSESERLNGVQLNGENNEEGELSQVDETTTFRQTSGDSQRVRQLSKRKRQQQRNRLHNNNQKIG